MNTAGYLIEFQSAPTDPQRHPKKGQGSPMKVTAHRMDRLAAPQTHETNKGAQKNPAASSNVASLYNNSYSHLHTVETTYLFEDWCFRVYVTSCIDMNSHLQVTFSSSTWDLASARYISLPN